MKKKLVGITKIQKAAIVVACIGFFSILIYMIVEPDLPVFMKKDVTMKETVTEDGGAIIEVKENLSAVEGEFPLDMSEDEIRAAIHSMTHQKVISEDDEKWGEPIPLTQKRVIRLLDVLDHGVYADKQIYEEILKRWQRNDFSNVARDHNSMWYMDGGTIGYAEGIMSAEEEAEYIKANFDVNE